MNVSTPLLLAGLIVFNSAIQSEAQLPAFPGAEGFGATAIGGRFGDVYHVTNLSSDAKQLGSFAYGLTGIPDAGRTIMFDVSGYIPINGKLTLNHSKVTIAGQTAPGDGIGFMGGTFLISASDVVIRHVRFRDGRSADALNLDSHATNCILDHCEVSLGKDENLSSFRHPADNFTFQWSINSWGMETHSCGGLWDFYHATSHHSLWSHNHTRNPKARSVQLQWINNITFDWDIGFIMGDSESTADWNAEVIGSWFICPPGNIRPFALEKAQLMATNGQPNFAVYFDDAVMDANGDGKLNVSKKNHAIASGHYRTNANAVSAVTVPVKQDDSLTAYKKVLSSVGPLRMESDPRRSLRDELDTILVSNVAKQLRHHVHNPKQTGASNDGFGKLDATPAPADTDGDGLPDFWETAIGSNPKRDDHTNSVSANTFVPAGYTLLEDYLHFLATPHSYVAMSKTNSPTVLDVDLHRYTSGFTNTSPVTYSIRSAHNGKVSIVDGHIARFEPLPGFTGRASFDFGVTDGDHNAWDQRFLVLVTGVPTANPPR